MGCINVTQRSAWGHMQYGQIFEVEWLDPASVLAQLGLCWTCSETTLLVFPQGGSYVEAYQNFWELGRGVIYFQWRALVK